MGNFQIHFLGIIQLKFTLFRVCLFASNFAGIEFDSAWLLGISGNLATKGIYASNSNTLLTDKSIDRSIHSRYSIQDSAGHIYFPAGVTVGPGFMLPQAFFYKLFGIGFWQSRIFSQLAFFTFCCLFFWIIFKLTTFVYVIVAFIWLWCLPTIYIGFSFESYSELLALLYVLLGSTMLRCKFNSQLVALIASELFFGFAIQTKLLFLLFAPAGCLMVLHFVRKEQFKVRFYKLCLFTFSVAVPTILFELYRFSYLVWRFGFEGWKAANVDFVLTFKSGGGIPLSSINLSILASRIEMFQELNIVSGMVFFCLLMVGVIWTAWRKRSDTSVVFFASSFNIYLLWFLFACKTGWGRHAYPLFPLAIILTLVSLHSISTKVLYRVCAPVFLVCGLITAIYFSGAMNLKYNLDDFDRQRWSYWRRRHGRTHGLPPTDIMPLKEQTEVIQFIDKNIYPEDGHYFLGYYMVTELSTLLNRVYFPVRRYFYRIKKQKNLSRDNYLFFGPYQISKETFRISNDQKIEKQIQDLCQKVVFSNRGYKICKLKSLRIRF